MGGAGEVGGGGAHERTVVLPASLDGERVDRVVALLTGRPRAEVAAAIDAGRVSVSGRVVATRSRRVRAGQRLSVVGLDEPEEQLPAALPDVEVPVVYADEDLIVVDKPAGLVVHPGAGHHEATLVQGLLARYPELAQLAEPGAEERPGIVHRLDKGTSGLLVVARTAAARDDLRAQLTSREMTREYTTLVVGEVESDEGLIDAPIGRSLQDPTRLTVLAGGRQARTRYAVEARYTEPVPATLLACRLETGRTHQIRVHLTAIGHPVVGDARYGGQRAAILGGWTPLPADRPFLHARRLGLRHPRTGTPRSWESPLPADLGQVVARLAGEG